jgi:hypothetical protein
MLVLEGRPYPGNRTQPGRSELDPIMELDLPIGEGLSLRIADTRLGDKDYSTSRLQKGFRIADQGQELAEEAVGFGVPVVRRGLQTIFPGALQLSSERKEGVWEVTALFTLNLEERIARSSSESIQSGPFYLLKNTLAALIRRFPPVRGVLTALSSGLRRIFGWVTTYEDSGFRTQVRMSYALDPQFGTLQVTADTSSLVDPAITEVVLMNEQGARPFDCYQDPAGAILRGKKIGCWDEVTSSEGTFVSSHHRIAFRLPQVPGSKLFRGRELVGDRLAWSGFGYTFPPGRESFTYTVRIEKLP